MITFARCKEIFADKEIFWEVQHDVQFERVDMRKLANDGSCYRFGYRRMPNGYNDVAEVYMGKWTPMQSYLVCQNICDEGFLLALIKQCHEVGNF